MKKLILLLISGLFFSCQTDVDHNLFTFENFSPELINKDNIIEGEIVKIKINIDSANLKPNYKAGALKYTLTIGSDLRTKYLINVDKLKPINGDPKTLNLIQGENIVSFVVPKSRKGEANINLTLANDRGFEISKNMFFLIKENDTLTVNQKFIEEKDNVTNKETEKNILQIDIKNFKKDDEYSYSIKIDPMELKGSFGKDNKSLENNTFKVESNEEEIEYKPNENDKDKEGLHLIKVTLNKKDNINKDESIDYYFYFKPKKDKQQ